MDKVIFTGRGSLDHYKLDRPDDYRQLVESGELKKFIVKKDVSRDFKIVVTIFGFLFLTHCSGVKCTCKSD